MKKKITLTILALVCALCCAFGLAACGDNPPPEEPGNGSDKRAITKTEWEGSVNSKAFSVSLVGEQMNDAQKDDLLELGFWGNSYFTEFMGEKSGQGWATSDKNAVWVKSADGATVNYFTFNEKAYYSDDNFQMTPTTEQAYNEAVSPYIQLLDYVHNNYDKFSCDKEAGPSYVYSHDVATIKSECAAATQLGLTDLSVAKQMSVTGDTWGDVQITLAVGNLSYKVTFKPVVRDYAKDMAFAKLTNCTLKAGPSATDPDYAEYYLNENGFRMYTPNNADPNRRDGYYKYNAATDNYTQYVKQSDGSFVTATVSKSALQTVLDGVIDSYMYFVKASNATVYATTEGWKYKDVTKTVGQREHRYFDIEIKLDANGAITSATWKYQMTQGEQSTQVYNMELTAGNTTIEFPMVEATTYAGTYYMVVKSETGWTIADDAAYILKEGGVGIFTYNGQTYHVTYTVNNGVAFISDEMNGDLYVSIEGKIMWVYESEEDAINNSNPIQMLYAAKEIDAADRAKFVELFGDGIIQNANK